MSENLKQETPEGEAPEKAAPETPAPETQATEAPEAAEPETPKAETPNLEEPKPEAPKPEKERGFSHYVGFALLTLLAIIFFFFPGIAVTYLISLVGGLEGATAWIISAVVSALIWLIFKLKIKGWKRASSWYIIFCGLVLVIVLLVWQLANVGNLPANMLKILLP